MPPPLDREKTLKISEELETVIAAHMAWFKLLNRALVCGCPPAECDMANDAHLQSPFGQWYYGEHPAPLTGHPGFLELGGIQKALHDAARHILHKLMAGHSPTIQEHDLCFDLALKINTKLRQFQLDIIGDMLATDPLTGCYSRRGMIGRLQAEQERAGRLERTCCICLMDFDHFKRINDDLGHPAGDAVLRQGMNFVANVLRKYDTLFRYGGEEFLFCLPDTPLADAEQVIERVRASLEKLPIMLPNKRKMHVTASFGLADIQQGKPVEDTIARADSALLQAKSEGRNRVVLWRAATD